MSEILGGRLVSSYDVLDRIRDGLNIPAGYLGMAYDLSTLRLQGPTHQEEEIQMD